jgi:magnesium chelatase family protein
MVITCLSSAVIGIDAELIHAEIDILASQLPSFTIVGLPDKSVQEAKERIVSAIKNSGFEWPRKKIVVNLAPADIPKIGTSFDLPIAIGILIASDQLECNERYMFLGELALDGSLRKINGVLPSAIKAKAEGLKGIFIPAKNAKEASVIKDLNVLGAASLVEVVEYLKSGKSLENNSIDIEEIEVEHEYEVAFDSIIGQENLKRAAIIAVAGGHNLLFIGSPGSGKTLISRSLPSICPEMTFEESLEVTKIYSVANLLNDNESFIKRRPFRSPHHTASTVSIIGGGKYPKPGEISLAHRGILFLDEFPEFSQSTLESLRQPIEDKKVFVSRISGSLAFPANFMLIAAMNPCKCGWAGDPDRECTCTPAVIDKYRKKISGPIMDRIDLQILVQKVKIEDLSKSKNSDKMNLAKVRELVQKCRNIQLERYKEINIFSNAELPQRDLEKFCRLEEDARQLLVTAAAKFNLSARSFFRIIRVSRTIADLEESDTIVKRHIAESLQYRINE